MPLHTVDQHNDNADETAAVYATDLSMRTLPRRRMPDHGSAVDVRAEKSHLSALFAGGRTATAGRGSHPRHVTVCSTSRTISSNGITANTIGTYGSRVATASVTTNGRSTTSTLMLRTLATTE